MTTPAEIDALARKVGALEPALEDIRHRVQAHFADADPSTDEVKRWLEGPLYDAAAHLFQAEEVAEHPWEVLGLPESVWKAASPAQKLTWAREDQPLPVQRRPQPVALTEVQLAEMAALPPIQRLAAYRTIQQQAG